MTERVKYFYVITSVNKEGVESNVTSPVLWHAAGTDEYGELEAISRGPDRIIEAPEVDDSGPGCFIATAVYGSFVSEEVMTLKALRDGWLISSGAGNRLVEAYYAASPVFAEVVAESGILRKLARLHLAPLIKTANLMLNMN